MVKTELNLEELGKRLKMVDRHLIALLAQRMNLAREVEFFKRINNQPLIRLGAEEERLEAARKEGREKGLNPNFLHSLFYFIITESCRVQIDQLQTEQRDVEDISPQKLKKNLLALTKEIAPVYDKTYDTSFFATKSYIEFEDTIIKKEMEALRASGNLDLAIDLGCATGRITLMLADTFKKAVGYDISPAMIGQAHIKMEELGYKNTSFRVADIEEAITEKNDSVSLVVMNLGTASDILDIQSVLSEIKKVLKPNGKFVLSFYNSAALLYRCWFLPWQVGLAASINEEKNCLDVRMKNKIFSVYAKPYSIKEAQQLILESGLSVCKTLTYPTIISILPNEFFEEKSMQQLIADIDEQIINMNNGAYILITGSKEATM